MSSRHRRSFYLARLLACGADCNTANGNDLRRRSRVAAIPHNRHSVATHLMQRGAGIRYIQELLGHRWLGSTQIYTRVTITDLKRAHARYHPRERMDV